VLRRLHHVQTLLLVCFVVQYSHFAVTNYDFFLQNIFSAFHTVRVSQLTSVDLCGAVLILLSVG